MEVFPMLKSGFQKCFQFLRKTVAAQVHFLAFIASQYSARLPQWARHRFFYTGIFLLMGWLLLIRIGEIFNNLSWSSLALLGAGALSYSVGALIYACKRPNIWKGVFGFHELWHVMVVFGYTFHYLLVLNFYRATALP